MKPAALCPGDTIGIVAPASAIQPNLLEAGCRALADLGYKSFFLPSIFDQELYFAGSVDRRARELEEMFERDEVHAIIAARGGYGCNYLLPRLNVEKIKVHPKILMGYSDITSLLTYLSDHANLVTFHGPMVTKDFGMTDGLHVPSWLAFTEGKAFWKIIGSESGAVPLARGRAEGTLYGGCLSMLVASLGTPYEINTGGTILFIEDVNTKAFQIDRMLMQLKLASKLKNVHGIIFGEMLNCAQPQEQKYALPEVLTRLVEDLEIPVAYGLRSGHVTRRNITLPLGVRARLIVEEDVELTILEAATTLGAVQTATIKK